MTQDAPVTNKNKTKKSRGRRTFRVKSRPRVSFKTSLIVPTLNAGGTFTQWLEALSEQTLKPNQLLLIDSSSHDDTVKLAEKAGFKVHVIDKGEFNHGGTRQLGMQLCSNADIYIFLTQDAVLADKNSLANLVAGFKDRRIGAAYGRQLPRPEAGLIESHARLFNYPDANQVRGKSDIPQLGIKTSFISNSFAAWRKTALEKIGGFPEDTIQNEDAYALSKIILAGWKVAYRADAPVYHSHGYNYFREFQRYFDIGVFHNRAPWIRANFGKARGEGLRYVKSELEFLLRKGPHLMLSAFIRTFLKLLGFRLGLLESKIPGFMKKILSSNKSFWNMRRDS